MAHTLDSPDRLRFTADHVHALAEAGLFNENDRVELIDGEIYVSPPPSEEHTTVAMVLESLLELAFDRSHFVTREVTLDLTPSDLNTADLCVLDIRPPEFVGYPLPEHIVLLVEVAKTSHAVDRGKKLAAYAQAGIREYWIVDIPGKTVEVRTIPTGRRYGSIRLYGIDEVIPQVGGTSSDLHVADLFPSGINWDTD